MATGIVVLGSGLLVVFVPEAERLFPVEAAIEALGSDYVVVAVVGLLAVGLATLAIAARRVRGVSEADPPAVEDVQSASYPGEAFDQSASGILGRWGSVASDRRERLREAAIRATMRAEGCTRTRAAEIVAEGTWTDDPVAAGYLADDRRIGSRLRRSGRENGTIPRTVNAIARATGEKRERKRQKGRSDDGEVSK